MKLKKRLESLEGLSAELAALYVQKDNGFVLELDGDEDVSGLKSALHKEKEERRKAREELAGLKELLGDMDPAEAKTALAKIRDLEEKDLLKDGKIDELVNRRVEQMRGSFEAQIKALTAASSDWEKKYGEVEGLLSKTKLGAAVKDAAVKLGVRPEALDFVEMAASQTFKMNEGNLVAFGPDGSIKYGASGKDPLSVEEYLEGMRKDKSFLFAPNSGGGAKGSSQKNGKTVVSGNDSRALSANLQAIADGEVDVTL